MPETEEVIDRVLDGLAGVESDREGGGRQRFHEMFREAWTQKQDSAHEAFFDTWKEWSSPIVQFDSCQFAYTYPTSGASEAIREAIYAYGAQARAENFTPRIHLFDGEYEGFVAYAAAVGIEVQTHNRRHWPRIIQRLGRRDQFYLSQPSAVDGMIWDDYEDFVTALAEKRPSVQLMLDLTYVGCVSRDFTINANHLNIATIFFSLSKPAGVYYHRVGGMFARREYPGLFGNKWFKNLSSLSIGTEFMRRYEVHELPRKYRPNQERVTREVNEQLGLTLEPADVLLLATGLASPLPSELEQYLLRGSAAEQRVRVCLTPRMAHDIDPSLTSSVSARYYERIDSAITADEPQPR